MKEEYDFSRGKRGAVLTSPGKTRITLYIDNTVLERVKAESERTGNGYQTLINEALARGIHSRGQAIDGCETKDRKRTSRDD